VSRGPMQSTMPTGRPLCTRDRARVHDVRGPATTADAGFARSLHSATVLARAPRAPHSLCATRRHRHGDRGTHRDTRRRIGAGSRRAPAGEIAPAGGRKRARRRARRESEQRTA